MSLLVSYLADVKLEHTEDHESELGGTKELGAAGPFKGSAKHSALCTWDGSRCYKRTMVDACKQEGSGSAVSSARLKRVQEAAHQIVENRKISTSRTDVGGTSLASGIVSVLELGADLAFAFNVDGKVELWIGRLNQMRRKNESTMNTPILLDAAKEEGVRLVCTWFQYESTGRLKHNAVIDLKSYSSWSCMGVVELRPAPLAIKESAEQWYCLEDASAYESLSAALELTLQKPEAERSSVPGAYASTPTDINRREWKVPPVAADRVPRGVPLYSRGP